MTDCGHSFATIIIQNTSTSENKSTRNISWIDLPVTESIMVYFRKQFGIQMLKHSFLNVNEFYILMKMSWNRSNLIWLWPLLMFTSFFVLLWNFLPSHFLLVPWNHKIDRCFLALSAVRLLLYTNFMLRWIKSSDKWTHFDRFKNTYSLLVWALWFSFPEKNDSLLLCLSTQCHPRDVEEVMLISPISNDKIYNLPTWNETSSGCSTGFTWVVLLPRVAFLTQ